MGIKANATAVINLDGAKAGWLGSEQGHGLHVHHDERRPSGFGMQGLGRRNRLTRTLSTYARTACKCAPVRHQTPELPADPIIVHPDVRRMLLTGKAYTEAGVLLLHGWRYNWISKRNASDELAAPGCSEMVRC